MEVKRKEKTKKQKAFSGIGGAIRESFGREGGEMGNLKLWINLATVALGFLFGGCHLVFGSYPLGLALVSAMPTAVWLSLLGVALGSLTLGSSGIIYAMICLLAVFLRVIISGGDKKGNEGEPQRLFSESISLRVSSAVICGFVAAIYEILLEGFALETVLFGVSMVALPAIFTFIFCGAFYHGVGIRGLIFGSGRCFEASDDKRDRLKLVFLKVSLLSFIALAAVSLDKYNIFGINLSFVFSGLITLFAAKRFGALYGAVVGFVSSALVSGLYSPAFALAGAAGGALFGVGAWYAILVGGALLSLWGAYASGVSGFLALFPEYFIAACILFPMLRFFERESAPSVKDSVSRRATDMVGTMALAHRNRQALFSEAVESSVNGLIPAIEAYSGKDTAAEDYISFSKLLAEAKEKTLVKRELDGELTDKLEEVFAEFGFRGGLIRAFGDRRKYIICSGEDKDGTVITSPRLKERLEETAEMRLTKPEYYRRDEMVLMECEAAKKYRLEGAFVSAAGASGEVSGDTVKLFESKELFAYGLISDGMGSGTEAKRASVFVSEFLSAALGSGASFTTLMHMLNSIVRRGGEECGVTVDLFELDLITGEATFIKSGAAPSYIKRKSSLFRIKSETMPIGLIKQVDAERITTPVAEGDYIVMFSDGICEVGEDAPWLVEYLNKAPTEDMQLYAEALLAEARKNGRGSDDMSVLVMRVLPEKN